MSPNRVVALLTPLFAALAGLAAKLIAENAPGLDIRAEDLTSVFIGGSLIALAPALQWLHGWQKYEAREAEIQRAVEVAAAGAVPVAPTLAPPIPGAFEEYGDDFGEYGDEFVEYGDEFDEYSDELDEFGDELDESDDDMSIDLDEPAPTGG